MINGNHIIDYTVSETVKDVDVTGPMDRYRKFKAGERSIDIRVVYEKQGEEIER